MISRKFSILARLAGVAGLLFGLGVSGVGNAQGGTDALFEEVPLIERIESPLIESPLTLPNRSPEESADLWAAKAVLTEFFRRLNTPHGKPAPDLLTDEAKSRYGDREEKLRGNLPGEALVSYRIVNYAVYHDRGSVAFQYAVRATTDGVDVEEELGVTLKRMNDGKWKVDILQQGD